MFALLEVCTTSRTALADLLARMYFWTSPSLSRSLVGRHPCWTAACFLPCTRPPDIAVLPSTALAAVWTKAAADLVCTRPPVFVTFRRSFTVLSATAPSSSRLRAHPSCWFTHVGHPAGRPRTPGRIHSEDHIISQRLSPPSTSYISGGHTSLSLYWYFLFPNSVGYFLP